MTLTPEVIKRAKEALQNLLKTAPPTNFMMQAVAVALAVIGEYEEIKEDDNISDAALDQRMDAILDTDFEHKGLLLKIEKLQATLETYKQALESRARHGDILLNASGCYQRVKRHRHNRSKGR